MLNSVVTANRPDQPQPPDLSRRKATPGSWRPGQTGNRRGRPGKSTSLTDAIRRGVDVTELVEIALNLARSATSEGTRIAALGWLRDSGYVKPAERHEHVVGSPDDVSDDDLDALDADQLRELLAAEREFEDRRAAIVAKRGDGVPRDHHSAPLLSSGSPTPPTAITPFLTPPQEAE